MTMVGSNGNFERAEGLVETARSVLGFTPSGGALLPPKGTHAHGAQLAKTATKKKAPKPAPVDNPDALEAMAQERRRSLIAEPPSKFESKRSPAREAIFLTSMAQGWSVSKSAWTAGISSITAYQWKKDSLASLREDGTYADDFCVRWEAAYEDGVDVLEDAAHRRAVHGVEKPVYQQGVMVGTVTEYSDTLLGLALRGKKPARYNTERHEHSGPNGAAIPMAMEIEFIESKGKK